MAGAATTDATGFGKMDITLHNPLLENGASWWFRTNDLLRVEQMRYHCAKDALGAQTKNEFDDPSDDDQANSGHKDC